MAATKITIGPLPERIRLVEAVEWECSLSRRRLSLREGITPDPSCESSQRMPFGVILYEEPQRRSRKAGTFTLRLIMAIRTRAGCLARRWIGFIRLSGKGKLPVSTAAITHNTSSHS